MTLFQRVDHVGIAVPDLDAAIAWYTETFGMRVRSVETNDDLAVSEALLVVGDGETQIQLLAPTTPDSPIARFLERRGEGVQQIAYAVSDLDQAMTLLRDRGVELIYDRPRRGGGGTRVNFCHPRSAGGVLVELVEHPSGSPTEEGPGATNL